MKSRIFSLLFFLCLGTMALMHSPDPVPDQDVGTEAAEMAYAEPVSFELADVVLHLSPILPTEMQLADIVTYVNVNSPLVDLPGAKEEATFIRYSDKYIDPGSCYLAWGESKSIPDKTFVNYPRGELRTY